MNPTAFVSYSWDTPEHKKWVKELATRLRGDGVDVALDQWAAVPGDQLPHFMERSIRDNSYVLIVCTPNYKKKSDARLGGVGYEGDIMTAEVMQNQKNRKFIPILREGTKESALPSWLQGKYHVDFTNENLFTQSYQDLITTLHDAREKAPPLGKTPERFAATTPIQAQSSPRQYGEIRIRGVKVDQVTSPRNDGTAGSALYNVPFELTGSPNSEWSQLFINNWNRPPVFSTMHRPGIATVSGKTITLNGTTIEEVEKVHRKTLILVIEETNKQARAIFEARERDRQQRMEDEESHRKNVGDVAKRINFDED